MYEFQVGDFVRKKDTNEIIKINGRNDTLGKGHTVYLLQNKGTVREDDLRKGYVRTLEMNE